jgi:hypothetical protein
MRLLLPGNCYIWAIILKSIYGGRIFHIMGPFGPDGQDIKHYMVRDRKGKIRHFKRVMDFLPKPLSYYLFLGRLESSGKRRNARNVSVEKNIQVTRSEEAFDTILA